MESVGCEEEKATRTVGLRQTAIACNLNARKFNIKSSKDFRSTAHHVKFLHVLQSLHILRSEDRTKYASCQHPASAAMVAQAKPLGG